MKVPLFVVAAIVAVCVPTACSSGSGKSSAKPAANPVSTTATTKPTATLPPNTPRSEQFCSLTSALAEKFKGVKKPDGPEGMKPYIRELADFFQQAAPSAPAVLAPDVQKLRQFYSSLATRLESGATGASLPVGLNDLADASRRLRAYFSGICGVDDSVFNL